MTPIEIVICAVLAAAFGAAVFVTVRKKLYFSCGFCSGDCANCIKRKHRHKDK